MGRGSSGSGKNLGGSSGVNPNNIKNERDLVSERGAKQAEVDSILTVARDIHDEYGIDVGQLTMAEVVGKDSSTLAFSDGTNIGFNTKYLDAAKMDSAYDACVKSGFHPGRGGKSGLEAVAAHEFGHILTSNVGAALTLKGVKGMYSMDSAAAYVLEKACAMTGHKGSVSLAKAISGYAGKSSAECVAEAFADVYCNGAKASKESRAVVSVMSDILKSSKIGKGRK